MQVFAIFIALAIVVTGIFSHAEKTKVLGDADVEPTATSTPTSSPTPSPISSPTALPESTSVPSSTPALFNPVIYPNATKVSDNEYQTADSPEDVTNWYEDYIKTNNYNVKNVIRTKANGVVKNKVNAAKSDSKLEVEITVENGVTKLLFSNVDTAT